MKLNLGGVEWGEGDLLPEINTKYFYWFDKVDRNENRFWGYSSMHLLGRTHHAFGFYSFCVCWCVK